MKNVILIQSCILVVLTASAMGQPSTQPSQASKIDAQAVEKKGQSPGNVTKKTGQHVWQRIDSLPESYSTEANGARVTVAIEQVFERGPMWATTMLRADGELVTVIRRTPRSFSENAQLGVPDVISLGFNRRVSQFSDEDIRKYADLYDASPHEVESSLRGSVQLEEAVVKAIEDGNDPTIFLHPEGVAVVIVGSSSSSKQDQ